MVDLAWKGTDYLMKFKIYINDENIKKELENILIQAGLKISDEADFIITEESPMTDKIMGKMNDKHYPISIDDIIQIESFGQEIFCDTLDGRYKIKEKLKYLEFILDTSKFIRISQSVIINKNKIKNMSSMMGMKFKINLFNNKVVYVNRTYYYRFKEFIGIWGN